MKNWKNRWFRNISVLICVSLWLGVLISPIFCWGNDNRITELKKEVIKYSQNKNTNQLIRTYSDLGRELMIIGNYDEARNCYQEAVKIESRKKNKAELLANLAAAYKLKNEPKRGIDYLREATELVANNWQYWLELGKLYLEVQLDTEAQTCLFRALKLNNKNAQIHFYIAKYYMTEKLYERASEYYLKSITMNGNQPDYYAELSVCYTYLNEEKQAIQMIQKAIELLPEKKYYYQLSYLYFLTKQYDLSLNVLDRIIQLDNKDTDAYIHRGILFFKKGAYSQARKELEQAIQLRPQSELSYLLRALVNLSEGERKLALDDSIKSKQIAKSKFIFEYAEKMITQIKKVGK